MKYWFISDIHIKKTKERNGQYLLRFLHFLKQNPSENKLYLLGDIFDFWVLNGKAFYLEFHEIVDSIDDFVRRGGKVIYLEGNHDFHIDSFWTKKFQIPVYEDFYEEVIDGIHIRMEHGDFINPYDTKYLNYRSFVRQKWVENIGRLIPSFYLKKYGEDKSSHSRKKTAAYATDNVKDLTEMIRTYAVDRYQKDPYDLLITGHMHIRDDYECVSHDGNKFRSINLGTWLVDEPLALKIENGQTSWIKLSALE